MNDNFSRKDLSKLKPAFKLDADDDMEEFERTKQEALDEVMRVLNRDSNEIIRDRIATLRNVMLDADVGRDRFDEMMGSPEIVLDVAIAHFDNRRHTVAAPGEAELGHALMAHVMLYEPYYQIADTNKYRCWYCKRTGIFKAHEVDINHGDKCLYERVRKFVRARALRGNDRAD